MSSIAKKPRSVKRQKGTKKPPRFTIKKDSLGRRYALDKRTGKRASLSKAEKERISRKKIGVTFRGITDKKKSQAAKKGWETRRRNKRSEAAKRGWETKRKKVILETVIREKPPTFAEQVGALIPEGMRMHVLNGIADRSQLYAKVAAAVNLAWINMQVNVLRQVEASRQGITESTLYTPRFDRLYGENHGSHIYLDFFARAADIEDIDQIIDYLDQDEDNDYVARELYTLYFSPEVA
jgi:hypothetical protein